MRDQVFTLRLTQAEREAIDQAASDCDVGPTTWARLVLLGAIDATPLGKEIRAATTAHRRAKRSATGKSAPKGPKRPKRSTT